MQDLHRDPPARLMNAVGHDPLVGDVLGGEEARGAGKDAAFAVWRHAARHHQTDPAARAFMVKVDLPSDATGLNPGMFARVHFDRPAPDALTVPVAAISARSSLDRLFVVEDGVAQLRLVTLGVVAGERVVVLSGLSPGESVVVDPPSNLRDRDAVEETR